MLHSLMEQRKLKQRDLLPLCGRSRGLTPEVVSGKRAVIRARAKKLAEFFHGLGMRCLSETAEVPSKPKNIELWGRTVKQ